MHYVEQSSKRVLTSHPTYKNYSEGYTHAALIDRYLAKAGDVLWTSVGCVHAFANVSAAPVRWLETFSPQPPAENIFRFMAQWEQRANELSSPR